jgi:hypothetical protein
MSGLLRGQGLGGHRTVVEMGHTGFHGVQLCDLQGLVSQVNAEHMGAPARHRFGQDATAASDVHHVLALDARELVDPVQAQGVDLVQGSEFAVRIPPFVGQVAEFGEFLGVGVRCHGRDATQFGGV